MTVTKIQEPINEPIKWVNEDPLKAVQDYSIYKIMPLKFFLTWLENKQVRLEQISSWDDKFELFLFKQKYRSNYDKELKEVNIEAVSKAIYGQSWSLCPESDAMWHIYSPNCLSVKIHTTTNKLIKALEGCSPSKSHMITYLGRVNYYSLEALLNRITTIYVPNGVTLEETMVCSLFDKRDVLSYENEFRWAIIRATQTECNGYKQDVPIKPYLLLDIDPKCFVDEVCFDYRLDDNLYNSMKCCVQKFLPNAVITKSTLADFTPMEFTI